MNDLAAAPASPDERERLREDFVRLCEIASPSRSERAVADAVRASLIEAGLEVEEDAAGEETGSDCGNLLARVEGPEGAPAILLCAHLDTVPLAAPVEVVVEHGAYTNANEAILGADNKSAVAALLAVARRLAHHPPRVGVELLFTVCEEIGLLGAKAFDAGRLRAGMGFVFDHASPVGKVIVAAPSLHRVEARFIGRAAHAGLRPETGHNAIVAAAHAVAAMPSGRLDDETTANIGTIAGGSETNVVAERCTVVAETRGLNPDRAAGVATQMVDAVLEAAAENGCDVETDVVELLRAYRMPRTSPPAQVAAAGLEACGFTPAFVASGGGSDAHVFTAAGIPTVNVANGTEANHEPTERVGVETLEEMLDVTLAIVAAAA